MSTFRGPIEEIPGISVDRFDNENLSSSIYFLSHCHTDHMRGLGNEFFHELKETNRRLYCSALSKEILVGKFKLTETLMERITVMAICSPIIVDYNDKNGEKTLTVNSLPAGHCPGSIMFIFENSNFRILYTGDYRISPRDFSKLKPLNEGFSDRVRPKKFHKIYLDTTFLNTDFPEFPTRQRSLEEICESARKWLSMSHENHVSIECSAIYGSEYLYMEIMRKLEKPVHVRNQVFEDFSKIDDLSRSITIDPKQTRIHACTTKNGGKLLQCTPKVEAKNILTIVPSAMRWKNRDLTTVISEWDENVRNRFYVCTSTHASYNELKAFVEYFKPNDIYPCVDPPAYTKIPAIDFLKEIREKMAIIDSPKIDYDLSSLIGKPTKKCSNYFSDDSSD